MDNAVRNCGTNDLGRRRSGRSFEPMAGGARAEFSPFPYRDGRAVRTSRVEALGLNPERFRNGRCGRERWLGRMSELRIRTQIQNPRMIRGMRGRHAVCMPLSRIAGSFPRNSFRMLCRSGVSGGGLFSACRCGGNGMRRSAVSEKAGMHGERLRNLPMKTLRRGRSGLFARRDPRLSIRVGPARGL